MSDATTIDGARDRRWVVLGVTKNSGRAEWLRQARSYLRNGDPVLARLIDERPEFDPRAWLAQLPPMDRYLFSAAFEPAEAPAAARHRSA